MKKINNILYILFAGLLFGCSQEESLERGFGYLQLSSIEYDKSIVQSKAAAAPVLALDIIDPSGKTIKHADDWTTIKNTSLVLPVGNYTLKAYNATGDERAQGFDAPPFYRGENTIPIEKGIAKTASVTCGLAQAKVEVKYSERFKLVFATYSSVISNSIGNINFNQNETRQAFVAAGEALSSSLTMAKSGEAAKIYEHVIAAKTEPKTLYSVTYDVADINGSGDFTVTVDVTVQRYQINTTVPQQSDVDPNLTTGSADAWGQFAYLTGTSTLVADASTYKFQYKKPADASWTEVPAQLAEGTYKAKTGKLEFNTAYEYRLTSGTKVGPKKIFTTEPFEQVPNLDFETWVKSGKVWYPNAEAKDNIDEPNTYWATGNEGVTMFKDANSIPVEGAEAHTGKAAKLITVGNIMFAKAAAGNIFIGGFKTNASVPASSVTFGRPYKGARPVSLSGYYKYEGKAITSGNKPGTLSKDEGHIYIRLWDANEKEIGYGEMIIKEDVLTYQKFTINVNYTDPTAKPAKITIVATSSHYGGEFSGQAVVGQVGAGSTLWIDDFELSYYK